ncbi:MAG: hypothetical protein RL140_65 [Actinomycetota bacterium]|jgi:Gpi18-like mannosyltransferase
MSKPRFWQVLTVLLALGLGIRLYVGFVLFPNQGFLWDLSAFGNWMANIQVNGLSPYGPDPGFNYPPVFADLLLGVMALAGALGVEPITLIKLLGILPDIAAGAIIALAGRKWFTAKQGLIGAGLYLIIPITWYDSAVWGQVDSLAMVPMILAVWLLIDRKPEWAFVMFTLAVLTKPQGALILFILLPVMLGQIRDKKLKLVRLASALGAAFLTFLVICLPWDMESYAPRSIAGIPVLGDVAGLIGQYIYNANYFHVLTANAYNIWALGGRIPLSHLIQDDEVIWIGDKYELLGVPAQLWGTGLFLIVALLIAFVLFRRHEPIQVLTGFALLLVAFFVLPTRVHERYLVQAFVILAVIWSAKVWQRIFLVLLSIANTINLHAILAKDLDVQNMNVGKTAESIPTGISNSPRFQGRSPEDFGLSWVRVDADFAREEWVVWVIVLIHAAALVLVMKEFLKVANLTLRLRK